VNFHFVLYTRMNLYATLLQKYNLFKIIYNYSAEGRRRTISLTENRFMTLIDMLSLYILFVFLLLKYKNMNDSELIKKLLDEIAWQKQLIEDTLTETDLTEFEKQWLRNLITYYKANKARLKKLLDD